MQQSAARNPEHLEFLVTEALDMFFYTVKLSNSERGVCRNIAPLFVMFSLRRTPPPFFAVCSLEVGLSHVARHA